MAIRKPPRWVIITLSIWAVVEIGHQLYLRALYVENGDYDWERYVVERSIDDLRTIAHYVQDHQKGNWYYGRNPNVGSLSVVPDSVRIAVEGLRRDLLSGRTLFSSRRNFSIASEVSDSNSYEVAIYAGATFKQSYNGYDFSMIITSKGNPSDSYGKYTAVGDPGFYVEKMWNRAYRSFPILLYYNCNSYDLLVTKLWRWMI